MNENFILNPKEYKGGTLPLSKHRASYGRSTILVIILQFKYKGTLIKNITRFSLSDLSDDGVAQVLTLISRYRRKGQRRRRRRRKQNKI